MGKSKASLQKSLQYLGEDMYTTTEKPPKGQKNGLHQVYVQQSVTILAFKDRSAGVSTPRPDVLKPRLFLGILSEDIPLFVGAIIGASLIVVLFLLILTFWKCCCRMQLLKSKKYWIHSKDKAKARTKHLFPSVVQSNSVVFLGLKQSQVHEFRKMEKNLEESPLPKRELFYENEDAISDIKEMFDDTLPVVSTQTWNSSCPPVITTSHCIMPIGPTSLPSSTIPVVPITVSTEPNHVKCNVTSSELQDINEKEATIFSTQNANIPAVVAYSDKSLQSSPAFFHRTYHSGTFDQQSLYSCTSHMGSEMDLKTCNFTWSSYSLRPSSTGDCYYDLFQRASLCKKRKNRMRSDIAAAIALNRSRSSQLNKERDTDSLVENEVEIVLSERTTL